MSAIDDLLSNAERWAADFDTPGLPAEPARRVTIVTCMDARFLPGRVLDIQAGDVHLLRNAGGVVTDDVLRSIAISQRMLGTREVMIVMHTKCGLRTFTDSEWRASLEQETGETPPWREVRTTADVEADVRTSVRSVRECAFIPHTDVVRGFVYDVDSGQLNEVEPG
jgi:carbonic anhydrase